MYNVESFAFSNTDGNEILLGKISFSSPSIDYLECLNYTTIDLTVTRTKDTTAISTTTGKSKIVLDAA